MLNNYLRIAVRNFKRQPGYTLLNILGLTLGITATLFILLYITEENNYDQYHEKKDCIFRISSQITEPDNSFKWAVTQTPLAPQLKKDYPEVEEYVRFIPNGRTQFEHENRFFFSEKVFIVDSTVCDVFSFNFLQGDANTVLKEPNSIVVNETLSKRIFGKTNPIGEVLKTPSGRTYNITGIYEDMPTHSHLIANAMISSNTFDGIRQASNWGGFNIFSYVLLKEGTDAASFAAKLPDVIKNYVAAIFDQYDIKVVYSLLPLTDIHLTSDFEGEPEPLGEIGFLYIFGAIGLFLLLIACINYMNLATARATKRATEVGIRKVLGSERSQLIIQFLSESILFTTIALLLSLGLVVALITPFNIAFNLNLTLDLLFSPTILLGLVAILVLVGVVGGSYPAFFLSAFKPISILKGSLGSSGGNPNLRKGLVTVQFAITLFMLVGTGVIYDQMSYLNNKDLGFDKEHVMTLNLQGQQAREKYPLLRQKLLQNPKITAIGSADNTMGEGMGKELMNMETQEGKMSQFGIDHYDVDFDFVSTLGIPIVQGRDFSSDFSTDSTLAVLVNEAMVKRMAWTEPIGKKVQFGTADTLPVARVIGVVKDFHQQSLYDPISALMFTPDFNNGVVQVRMKPQDSKDLSSLIAFAENEWRSTFPNTPFEYEFLDASFMELYEADQMRAKIFTLFSLIMIFIACLGLLGLASFTAEQRTKEIGVRKILGAETPDIVYLLTRNFVILAAVATIPAFVAAWFFMNNWLDTFAYHTSMNYWLYGLAFLIVLVITMLTTGYFALKAAWENPIRALRSE